MEASSTTKPTDYPGGQAPAAAAAPAADAAAAPAAAAAAAAAAPVAAAPPRLNYITTKTLLDKYQDKLTPFEISEALHYPRIYYFGDGANKIRGIPWAPNNHGYDDNNGYLHLVNNDHIAYRFSIIDKLGRGSFGQVIHAFDYKNNMPVAIKIIRNKKRFYQQALVEVRILEATKNADPAHNIVRLYEYFVFRNHLCLVFELLGKNLFECAKRNKFRGFPTPIVQSITSQMLSCLTYLSQKRIIHCDLRLENILLTDNTIPSTGLPQIKMIDFGSSCFINERVHTYIQSRFYRSPEVVLGLSYTMAIDMWSLGCIVAELALGQPLFPAENEHDLIIRIVSALGLPPASVMAIATRRKTFFDAEFLPLKQGANATAQIAAKAAADAEAAASGIPNHSTAPYYVPPSGTMPPANPLAVVLAKQDPALIDFVTRCLTWNPSDRMSIAEAWNHPWLRNARPGPPPMVLAAQQAAASSSSAASSDASAAASASSSSSSSETVASATLAAAASAATGGVSSSTAEQADSPKQSAMSRATGGGSPLSAGSSSSSSTTSSPSAGDVAAAAHHHAHHHHPAPVVTYSFEELAAGLRALYIGAPPPSTSGAPAVAGYDKAAYQK